MNAENTKTDLAECLRIEAALTTDPGTRNRLQAYIVEAENLAALRAEAGAVGNQLLAECYKAMTSAMAVIDAEAGVGRTNANALNALAACRVAIERRDTDRVWRCQSCFRVFPRGQHKECRPRPSQKD